jgi:prepilin peptidase CpaA
MLPILAGVCLTELVGLSVAAACDLRRRIVPNVLVLLLAANGLLFRLADRSDWRSLGLSVLTAAGTLLVLGQLARLGVIGGGDAKLIAAVTFMVPAEQVPRLLLSIMLAGGLVSCLYGAMLWLARRDGVLIAAGGNTLRHILQMERRRIACSVPMPYALAVLIGSAGFGLSEIVR